MEKKLKIRTKDKKYIYGTLRGSLRRPLIVFIHGLVSDMNAHQFFNGARYFEKHGLSSFRFRLYAWAKNARKLHQCTLKTHGQDLDRIIEYFRKRGVKKIFVIGHSYGGKTILMSKNRNFDAAVLWDPSHNSRPLFNKKTHYLKSPRGYLYLDGSYGIFVGKKMVEEERKFPWKEKISEFKVPVKIILAGKGVLVKGGKLYYAYANKPKAITIIKNASHSFDEEGAEEKLFEETLDWLKKF